MQHPPPLGRPRTLSRSSGAEKWNVRAARPAKSARTGCSYLVIDITLNFPVEGLGTETKTKLRTQNAATAKLPITIGPGSLAAEPSAAAELRTSGSVKKSSRLADAVPMPPDQNWKESPIAVELRTRYRCEMCHKSCFIPCTLTTSQFRQMELEASGVSLHEDAEPE